ncbi:hypothetical protein NO263_09915 [Gluconacetobacter entanii]|uniref:Uncharacterized protein n=1 Tax=Gluconacetobacter entanii TaxID=108528 RepID=A0A318PNM2_9PROT|nr:hypothetical protein [Gluconacetobacter entanii]MBE7619332.1 hypothetical protein [Komagataeibacter sp. FXV2]MCE2578671.1 hypothetical protein [Komagataeibacter sp. FNDCR1]MCW4590895.1 hypothetical protein [Gluconacetobacter entanii]MCW4592492.1 hypothetical protein [Gluconacetobacter entanii]NPC90360.1 hypothetical protein [Gluconacetobacter entanii]
MDPSTLLSELLPFIPAPYVGAVVDWVSFVIAASALLVRYWRPPAAGSRAAAVWVVVSAMAQARGWNAPAYQPDRKALMVPKDTPRAAAAATLGLRPDATRPDRPSA